MVFFVYICKMEKKETWKDIFVRQVDRGSFWEKLFKSEFDSHKFLDRSDAHYICKKAQDDAYCNVIELLDDENKIKEVEKLKEQLWGNDDSSLGM